MERDVIVGILVIPCFHFTDIAAKHDYHTFVSVENVRSSGTVEAVAIIPQRVYTVPNTHDNLKFKPEATI